jgi:superfamily I DNA/RNA helicase
MEFDAVLLALPAGLRKTNGLDVLDEWEQGLNREARRVLYVGASRARRVLAFGAGSHTERVQTILRDRGVDVESR